MIPENPFNLSCFSGGFHKFTAEIKNDPCHADSGKIWQDKFD